MLRKSQEHTVFHMQEKQSLHTKFNMETVRAYLRFPDKVTWKFNYPSQWSKRSLFEQFTIQNIESKQTKQKPDFK